MSSPTACHTVIAPRTEANAVPFLASMEKPLGGMTLASIRPAKEIRVRRERDAWTQLWYSRCRCGGCCNYYGLCLKATATTITTTTRLPTFATSSEEQCGTVVVVHTSVHQY